VKDVEISSPFHTNMTVILDRLKVKQLSMDVVHTIYCNTKMHGHFDRWPIEGMRYYSRNAESILSTLPRGNKYFINKDAAMQVRAVKWAKQAQKEANRRETAAGEKFFIMPPGHPRVLPSDSPVLKSGKQLDTSDYVLDKLPRKWAGMALAIKQA